ncbi:helix-turn-helix domain-containing protein [Lentzea jiangxiensis]|uniref:Glucose-6-phosphate isomerase n=1 Tax=Lentzea jiangxiensis TaxID=641025 RepID=A0A1H0SG41_9PSEU|nr:helix-turn-helix domain-containing protein [Lentzea jiangxiensis]SDP40218.1 glucose-6-phosphate isomerase [Lentzea jiangxiensis]
MATADDRQEWAGYCGLHCSDAGTGLSLDVSGARMSEAFLADMAGPLSEALTAMVALEAGTEANPDEHRMVGHYWLRAPDLAPSADLGAGIRRSWDQVATFLPVARERYRSVLHIGIGGSAVGPRLLCDAWHDRGGLAVRFLDNADPDGIDRALRDLPGGLERTLVSVVSKSGITPTPWQVTHEVERRFRAAGLDFAAHAVATTVPGSDLAQHAAQHRWSAVFPLWQWVGGRTSVTSLVGLLPAALAGADTEAFLLGAAAMDRCTRNPAATANPAALLALSWYWLGGGRGDRTMVVVPYRDRLALLPRWVQQLVMESLGKRLDRSGRVVRQGLTVHGHKGVSDQHSYFQQLRDGRDDSFVTLIGTHRGESGESALADHLFCGLLGTLEAFAERGRPALAITLPDYREHALGALLALFERAVGLYAELVHVNAYHQPGVDKHTALPLLSLRQKVLDHLTESGEPTTAEALADATGHPPVTVHRLLEHLAARDLVRRDPGRGPADTRYTAVAADA